MSWGASYTDRQLAAAVKGAGFTGIEVAAMVQIALAESGGRMVVNRSSGETPASLRGVDRCASYGPWQINYCPTRDRGTYRQQASTTPDLASHARWANAIYRAQGLDAWSVYTSGAWKRYERRGNAAAAEVGAETLLTDASWGTAVGDAAAGVAAGPLGAVSGLLDVVGNPRRLGYLLLGAAIAGVGVVLIVKEASPAGLALDAVKGLA